MRNEDLREILADLEDAEGKLTPEAVVAAADEDHEGPLGKLFEWDNAKAGHKYRIDQARALIRRVEVHHVVEQQRIRGVCYVHDPNADSSIARYVNVRRLRQDADSAHVAMVNEFVVAGSHLRRARDIARVLGFAHQLDGLLQQYDEVDAGIRTAAPTPTAVQ